ncbi:DUF835 domain-containing protein [Halobaculum magnesiiphilum]|uniref:DUF835 domain-containing protein n=1 Tax=Halobaculum magnesiiphilum TaxID=1017351 RepID=A0A8T8WE28_9EURY|nr:DUF835 domain-containing protein [Halobaculum magnesiiphilum]QZP38127.1 DUF835 domain-containing protein [Halobaculum magnesiiphilum]
MDDETTADEEEDQGDERPRSSLAELADRIAGGDTTDDRADGEPDGEPRDRRDADPDEGSGDDGIGLDLSLSGSSSHESSGDEPTGSDDSDEQFSWEELSSDLSVSDEAFRADEVLSEARNVMLIDSHGDISQGPCFECLARAPSRELGVVVVTFTDIASDWLADWRTQHGDLPAQVTFIRIGGHNRDGRTETISTEQGRTQVVRTGVRSPTDLTRLGISISRRLGEAEDRDLTPVLCFDAITDLLEYVDVERLFRFLTTLTGRVGALGGSAHYHADAAATDEETIRTLRQVFDDTMYVTETGSLRPSRND